MGNLFIFYPKSSKRAKKKLKSVNFVTGNIQGVKQLQISSCKIYHHFLKKQLVSKIIHTER